MNELELTKNQLKKYETLLLNENMLFELNAIPQMVVNKNRIIIRVNKKFRDLFKYSLEKILGKQTLVLTPSKEKFLEYAQYFHQTKDGIIKSEELEYKKSDGTIFWVKLEGNPINQQNQELFILWSFIDVTKEVKYREELKRLASTDPMTNLYNRRFFIEMSSALLNVAQREKLPLCVLILDIDKFKLINDTYGHAIGDDVIIHLASLMQNLSRKSDIVCRWGGEEFVILLYNTKLKSAKEWAEKIRTLVEQSHVTSAENSISYTVSIGCSAIKKDDLEYSINEADKALYRAKESGRNRVCL